MLIHACTVCSCFHTNTKIKQLQQGPYGLQNCKYLPSGPLQKKLANHCYTAKKERTTIIYNSRQSERSRHKSTHWFLFVRSRTGRTNLRLNKSAERSLGGAVNGQEEGQGRLLGRWACSGSGSGRWILKYRHMLKFTKLYMCNMCPFYCIICMLQFKFFKWEEENEREKKCPSPKVYKELRRKRNKMLNNHKDR